MSDPNQVQVHPLAALTEATFDNEVHRNRRLVLAGDIHTLTQMVGERDARIKELEAELGIVRASEAFRATAAVGPATEGEAK
ncbi:hypothetical protein LB517_10800 [Mesorhizobium sp. BR1-1-12]|uniref:hypothetical protein n=1 Tax=unclassified Mesorhizobium TaxID=325217 RepID=UPI001CCAD9A1|nr:MULTISPECIES: hypothetical protein [unclassified Mesorhizobium]MBZ9919099.1 hypothetical protein [Mesorhizobium sp. BR1-1-7]MBZ9970122.1 hypothetical protein [Mesorhizobium sp. BR1-1-12]